MNKKGISTWGVVLLIAGLLVAGYLVFGPSNALGLTTAPVASPQGGTAGPSTQLSAITILSTDALAATTTSAPATVYVFSADGSKYITSSAITSTSTAFNLNYGNTYQAIAVNTTTANGYYPVQFTINANAAAVTIPIQMYKTGSINLISVTSSADPAQGTNIAAAVGKTCGFNVNFAENTTAAAFNSPLIMCESNVSSVTQVNMGANGIGVVAANNLAPSRVSATSGYTFWTFNVPKMILSTDGTYKLGGTVVFNPTVTPAAGPATANSDTLGITCELVDQDAWINSNYQSMSLANGFMTAAQNTQTLADIGAADSNTGKLAFNTSATSYC